METLDLREFIASALSEIVGGISDAQNNLKDDKTSGEIAPPYRVVEPTVLQLATNGLPVQTVEFDIAVTVYKGQGTKGKIGVVASIFTLASQGESNKSNESISRIKFSVPITMPQTKKGK